MLARVLPREPWGGWYVSVTQPGLCPCYYYWLQPSFPSLHAWHVSCSCVQSRSRKIFSLPKHFKNRRVAKKRGSAFLALFARTLSPKPVETGSLKKFDEKSVAWMVEIKPLKEVRRDHVREVLRRSGCDLDRASRILGITPDALRRMIERYDISLSDVRNESES